MRVGAVLSQWAGNRGDSLAWRFSRSDVTYGELARRIDDRVRQFESFNIQSSDVVAVAVGDLQTRLEVLLALFQRGAHAILVEVGTNPSAEWLGASHLLLDDAPEPGSNSLTGQVAHVAGIANARQMASGLSIVRDSVFNAVPVNDFWNLSAGSYAVLRHGENTVVRTAGFDPGSIVTIALTVLSGGGTLTFDERRERSPEFLEALATAETTNLCLSASEVCDLLDGSERGTLAGQLPQRLICLGWHLDSQVIAAAGTVPGIEVHVVYPMFDVGYDTYSLVFGATSRSTAPRAGTRRMRSLPVTLAAGFRQCAPSEIGELWIIAADDLEEIVLAPLRAGKSIGEIVLQEQVRPIPTGLIARQYRGGVIELVEGRRGATVIGGRIVDMRKAERALLAQPEVKECVVVMRYEADEPRTIAYVGMRTIREDAVLNASASLRATLPSGIAIDYIVPLLSLPLDAAGAVDIAELMKIPVIDDALVSRVAEKFANDGTGPLTVFAVDFRLSRPRDVVPHFSTGSWGHEVRKALESCPR